ncbi:MAG: hypothetical protein EXR90_03100 [Methyloglobulus sp.]|nr:hypothetical protein [Methyloglobulus sp.]
MKWDWTYTTPDLIDNGYNGAIMLHKELGNVIEIVSFFTNKVKSATENNGDFSQSNNNIKFSRTHTITRADNSAMRSLFAKAQGKQALGWLGDFNVII